jgi:hypothetical protein
MLAVVVCAVIAETWPIREAGNFRHAGGVKAPHASQSIVATDCTENPETEFSYVFRRPVEDVVITGFAHYVRSIACNYLGDVIFTNHVCISGHSGMRPQGCRSSSATIKVNIHNVRVEGVGCSFFAKPCDAGEKSHVLGGGNAAILQDSRDSPIIRQSPLNGTNRNNRHLVRDNKSPLSELVGFQRFAQCQIGFIKGEILEVSNADSGGGGQKQSYSGPYYRIAEGGFLLLCYCLLGGFGIVGIYRLNEPCNNQPKNSAENGSRMFIVAAALIIGWSLGAYGTILFLLAFHDLTSTGHFGLPAIPVRVRCSSRSRQ